MLQTLRDNMKSTIFLVVVILFVVPMVLSGVGGGFLGTVAGTDAASVNDRNITKVELNREIEFQRQRMLSQEGVDPTADYLKQENLRAPVLDRLTRRAALLSSSADAGLGVAEKTINSRILEQENFFEDGKFSAQRYRRLLSNVGFTPATFKRAMGEDIILRQQQLGLRQTGFATNSEVDVLISLIKQKRSFDVVEIPSNTVAESVNVAEESIADYYTANQPQFVEAEKARIEYIEVTVDDFTNRSKPSEEDILALYQREVDDAKTKQAEIEVAHILIEDGDEAQAKIQAVKDGLSKDQDFAELAKTYSDDLGSAENGGGLGFMVAGMFPDEFEEAASQLALGQVSDPIKTDSGIHFIKVINHSEVAIPSLEDRRDALTIQIARSLAEEEFERSLEQLESLTYGSESLAEASKQLELPIKKSGEFSRTAGQGVAADVQVRDAAYATEVLSEGRNSAVLELAQDKALVLRVLEHTPEQIKPLERVTEEIREILTESAIAEALQEKADLVIARIKAGEPMKDVATELGYKYSTFDAVERTTADASFQYVQIAFAMGSQSSISFDTGKTDNGIALVALTNVTMGDRSDMPEQQRVALASRLRNEAVNLEISSYELSIVENADINIH